MIKRGIIDMIRNINQERIKDRILITIGLIFILSTTILNGNLKKINNKIKNTYNENILLKDKKCESIYNYKYDTCQKRDTENKIGYVEPELKLFEYEETDKKKYIRINI